MFDFFKKIKDSMSKTRKELMSSLAKIIPFGSSLSDSIIDEIEEALYQADLGVHSTELIIEELRKKTSLINKKETDPYQVIKETITTILKKNHNGSSFNTADHKPFVILVIGVNGAGKTTTIGKLAMRFRAEGKTVLLAACDTFRAAAVEQLEIWAKRADAEFIKAEVNADPASVAFDAMTRAKARMTDILIIDTAGRLHTSRNLMEELKKIDRVIKKSSEHAPHETMLVLDASNGQNALSQADIFNKEMKITGIAITKLDGTARGGIIVSIADKLGIPVKLIGLGESIEDLRDFEPEAFTEALFVRDDISE